MTSKIISPMSDAFVGRTCRVTRREFDWLFSFEGGGTLVVTTAWRIISGQRIAFADKDHGHQFGLPEPIDGEERTNRLLARDSVRALTIDPVLADLSLHFESGTSLEIFNGSSGYEAWQVDFLAGNVSHTVVGVGGGGLTTHAR